MYPRQNSKYSIPVNVQSCARYLKITKFAENIKIDTSNNIRFTVKSSLINEKVKKLEMSGGKTDANEVIKSRIKYINNNIKKSCQAPLKVGYSYRKSTNIDSWESLSLR